ncbi:MAG: exosortase H, partial [Syntrophobacteraceae bacterium]
TPDRFLCGCDLGPTLDPDWRATGRTRSVPFELTGILAVRRRPIRKKQLPSVQGHEAKPTFSWSIDSLLRAARSGRVRFAAGFTLACLAFYGLILWLPPAATRPLNEHTARAFGLLLHVLGIPASTAGDVVSAGGLAFRIIPECTPVFTGALLISLIAFYPAGLREKAVGVLLGIPVLYLGNLARLIATFAISRYDRNLFDVVHVYLGQLFTMLLVILACLGWLRWINRDASRPVAASGTAHFLARFVLISGSLFFVWLKIHHGYIWLLDCFMRFGFSLFNYRIEVARHTAIYYETFSIVGFTSLLLASRSLSRLQLTLGLTAGLGLLSLSHLFHRIDNGLTAAFHYTGMLPLDVTLLVAGQYLLPLLFLIVLAQAGKDSEVGLAPGRHAKRMA